MDAMDIIPEDLKDTARQHNRKQLHMYLKKLRVCSQS